MQEAYQKALRGSIELFIRFGVAIKLLAKVFEYFHYQLQQWRDARLSLQQALNLASDIPEDTGIEDGFQITSEDFGFSSWDDKTPDSDWKESYLVKSHLINASSAGRSDQPIPFPDFLSVYGDNPTKYRGLVDWLQFGPRSDFPWGSIAASGFQSWLSRIGPRASTLFQVLQQVRAIAWPTAAGPAEDNSLSSEGNG